MAPLSNFLQAYILITLAINLPKLISSQIPTSPTYFGSSCRLDQSAGNYTQNSIYGTNLNLVFSKLITKASTAHFFNSSAGSAGDTAYGQYYCRGDISAQLCQNCVKAATQVAMEGGLCYPLREALIVFYECTLRYDVNSNVGKWSDTMKPGSWYNKRENVSDITMFNKVLPSLIPRLIKKAAYGGDPLEFATGEEVLTQFETVYCLVQCSPDIVGSDCESCLSSGQRFMGSKFLGLGPPWGFVFYPNCQLRYTLTPFYLVSSASPPTPPSIDAPPSGKGAKHNVIIIVIPVAVGSILLLCTISFAIWFCSCRRKSNPPNSSHIQQQTTRDVMKEDSEIGNIACFEFRAIEEATMKFSLANKLGEGGFGSVYKGILSNGNSVAIKRLSINSVQGIREFKTEVAVVAKLQHRNLVRLAGFCVENEERVLVYEYLPNLSLDKFLFDEEKSSKLDWRARYLIIEGVASGLRYLHIDSMLTIVHRDLKTSNILLDDEMKPKIADFGLAKLVKFDEATGNTSRIAGTFGYMAPEYAMAGTFSIKSDIYSFGVIILEILSGKSISHFYDPVNGYGLLHYAWNIWNERAIERLVDPTLQHKYSKAEAERCLQIGLLCVQDESTIRPPIRIVVGMLENQSLEIPNPSAPSCFLRGPNPSVLNSDITQPSQVGFHDSSSGGMYTNEPYPR